MHGNTKLVTKELLKLSNLPAIVSILISSEDSVSESKNPAKEKSKRHISWISFTSVTSIKILAWQVITLTSKIKCCPVKHCVTPNQFFDLNDDVTILNHACLGPPGVSYGEKPKKPDYIPKETNSKLGSSVSVDQRHWDQPVLLQQSSGKLTCACIWSAQVILKHYSNVTYVYLMKRTSQQ